MKESIRNPDHRRGCQRRDKKPSLRQGFPRKAPWLGLWGVGCGLVLGIVLCTGAWISARAGKAADALVQEIGGKAREETGQETGPLSISREALPDLLKDVSLSRLLSSGVHHVTKNGSRLTVESSLDVPLQYFVQDLLDSSHTVQAAAVVLRPDNGQILAMANHDDAVAMRKGSLCLKAEYPAASLFKIIAAAAAIEARGFTPEKTLTYRGGKHTLYRGQLAQDKGRGRSTRKTTLRTAFSESNNPVFGKIGIHTLGRRLMNEYAHRFFFNRPIPFDLPVARSAIELPNDDFGLAEIASGYNRTTTMSPLHASLVTSAVVNGGTVMEPWLVKSVKDESGRTLYEVMPARLGSPIRKDTAGKMRALMQGTVISGTGKKAFRSLRHRREFREIELGAKTGTINDVSGEHRVDWITAYALPDGASDGICITILALHDLHGERFGIRAKDMVRRIIDYYYTS